MPETTPYGAWTSPISAEMVAASGVGLSEVQPSGSYVYWVELRPTEGGRSVVVRVDPGGALVDVTPEGFNARTRVHEYGGGCYVARGETVVFANLADQRLYRQDGPADPPRPITPEPSSPGADRYADMAFTPDGRHLVAVRERHEAGRATEVVNELVAMLVDGSMEPWVLAEGHDFFSFPRPSPDGTRIAWTSWDHPNMPWDGSELYVAAFDPATATRTGEPRLVAGGLEESVFQPAWSPDGALHFVSDRTGWWNLYRLGPGDTPVPLYPTEAECGVPQWVFGMSTYGFLGEDRIALAFDLDGMWHLGVLHTRTGRLERADLPYTSIRGVRTSEAGAVTFVGATPTRGMAVIRFEPTSGGDEVLKEGEAVRLDAAYVSHPEPIEFPTEGGLSAHALSYPPTNPDHVGPAGERPPLLVLSHGGPTSQAPAALDPEIQFWTSRGFGVVDVNYGGSTGYGRPYRERLRGAWGVVDLQDCVNAARYLADRGDADPDRLAIRGGSAGGYTTLCALVFTDAFAAGASYYGVADAESLAAHTHKFESRYLDGLIGPYPEAAATYRERSPIHYVERMSTPVILFQGLDDLVVPREQAEVMVEALAANAIPHAYLAFEGEDHGFRRAETIRRCLEAELSFYGQVLGFIPAGDVEPVEITG
jgi:dipeptidyl aminopeptidase/acylaminoacyl peptidase